MCYVTIFQLQTLHDNICPWKQPVCTAYHTFCGQELQAQCSHLDGGEGSVLLDFCEELSDFLRWWNAWRVNILWAPSRAGLFLSTKCESLHMLNSERLWTNKALFPVYLCCVMVFWVCAYTLCMWKRSHRFSLCDIDTQSLLIDKLCVIRIG